MMEVALGNLSMKIETSVFSVIGIFVALIIGLVIIHFVQKEKNGSKPKIKRIGRVIDKRSAPMSESLHSFYLTLEFDDCGRAEVKVKEWEYGLIVIGDQVNYIAQGSWQTIERL
ncbi:DUF2500 family protein [Paenibacillus sp. WLX2291]|uniref:DUF2500 family protein n=1 Tax=Paenibacillus sp. WLX2291 TaxID=3296934 RepID=UPI003984520B